MSAAIAMLSMVGCSDYDNGYTEAKLKFINDFREAFGDIDPEQDWNLAERASVTVSTMSSSNIKIYALKGNEYAIVGDYEGVTGTQVLGFDVIEGTTDIIVSDGMTAQTAKAGDVLVFGADTRTTYTGTTGLVTVSKLTGDVTLDDGKTYPQYKYKTESDYNTMVPYVPEHVANLNKVTHDFTYVSNGSFIIYPYHWETSSYNTIGVYYYDANGTRQEVDVYKIKASNQGEESELVYENYNETVGNIAFTESYTESGVNDWTLSGNTNGQKECKTYTSISDESGIETPFYQYVEYSLGQNLSNAVMKRYVTGLEANTDYYVEIAVRMLNQNSSTEYPTGVTFSANSASVNLGDSKYSKTATTNANNTTYTVRYSYMEDPDGTKDNKVHLKCTSDAEGKIELKFDVNGFVGNWLSFNDLVIKKVNKGYEWASTNDKGSFGKVTRGQGIKVDIPAGTKFGMYLKKSDTVSRKKDDGSTYNESKSYQFFSEGRLNDPDEVGCGVVVNQDGSMTQVEGMNPCYTSTFYIGDQMFIGFEDWPNDTWAWGSRQGDFDLNDLVLAFDGVKPTIINEDPVSYSWMLACEDLGGSFDTDYNDVVFKVEHVSGQSKATIVPLAAGGTLASYIFYTHPTTYAETCIGEVHQLFGAGAAESGDYTPTNVGASRGNPGTPVTIEVPTDWSMAIYSTNAFDSESDYNMGGFEIRTLPIGTPAPTGTITANSLPNNVARIPAPDMGAAPYMICLPYSYIEENTPSAGKKTETIWAWPQELIAITPTNSDTYGGGCYPEFKDWVTDHKTHGEWYKNKSQNAATVSEWKIVTDMQTHQMLTVIEDPLFAEVDQVVYLNRNIVPTPGGGDITYRITYMLNGVETPMPKDFFGENGVDGVKTAAYGEDITFTPNQAGTVVYVYVTQGDDTKRFELKVTKKQVELQDVNFFTTSAQWLDTSLGPYTMPWNGDSNDHDLTGTNFYSDERLLLMTSLGNYSGEGSVSATINGNGTGTTIRNDGANRFIVTAGSVLGKNGTAVTVTLHFSGDATYKSKDITVTLNYVSRQNVKFTTGAYALACEGGKLVLQWNGGNAEQQWALEQDGTGYYNIYNISAKKYLVLNGTWGFKFQDARPEGAQDGKFKFESKNGGIIIITRKLEASRENNGTTDVYWGVDGTAAAGKELSPRKTYDNALVFTQTSNAKQRNSKRK